MDSSHHVTVPLRYGIKKMRKRRDLDALLSQTHTKSSGGGGGGGGGGSSGGGPMRRCNNNRGALYSQDKLLNNASTDDQEDYNWPKVKHAPHHCGHNKHLIFRLYGILLFVITLSIFVGFTYWLNFNLQQQIYEYRQKVEQVSAASQILPDTLQAWHETSKNLIKNQTSMSLKLTELHQSLQELWKNFSEYRTSQEAQKSYEKEEKIVADFGAKIEAIATDVESMKDHYNAVKEKQTDLQTVFENLKSNFSDGLKNMALPVNYTEELKALRSDLQTKIDKLEANNSYINDTLTQKSIIMQEELVNHKTKLDELFDRSANITSHVTSLENSWPEYKQKIINLGNDVPRLEKDISMLTLTSQKIEMSFKSICKECQNSYIEALQHNIAQEKKQQQQQQHKPVEITKPSETKSTKLDELFDRSANITSHVTSLENSWPEYKQKIINLGNDVPRLEKDISMLTLTSQKIEMSFKSICKECQNSYIEALQHNIAQEKKQQQQQQHKPVEITKPSETKSTTTTLRPSNIV